MAVVRSTLLARIQAKEHAFSKSQRKLAEYIINHCDKAAYMNASNLGKTVDISESTVVRFASELGLKGFPELQKAMKENARSQLTAVQRMELSKEKMSEKNILEEVLSGDIINVKHTLEELDPEIFENAVSAIVSSKTVYIYAAGSSRSLGSFLQHYLKLLHGNVHLITSSGEAEIFEEMLYLNKEDTVIGISFPRYSSKAVKTLDFASSKQAKVIAITDSQVSPIAEYADYLLLAHNDLPAIVDSLVAPLSLINALIVAISLKQSEDNKDNLSKLEEIWDKYGVYNSSRKDL